MTKKIKLTLNFIGSYLVILLINASGMGITWISVCYNCGDTCEWCSSSGFESFITGFILGLAMFWLLSIIELIIAAFFLKGAERKYLKLWNHKLILLNILISFLLGIYLSDKIFNQNSDIIHMYICIFILFLILMAIYCFIQKKKDGSKETPSTLENK